MNRQIIAAWVLVAMMPLMGTARAGGPESVDMGPLKPVDSVLKVAEGDRAPDFSLPSVSGGRVGPGDYLGRKNVVLSFVPAAWTPVCSQQWPDFNQGKEVFEKNDAVLLGIAVDNIPTLAIWTRAMGGLWFPVLSDFHPHGAVAGKYGVLRSDGMAERALIYIDKQGIIRRIEVGDINKRPLLATVVLTLSRMNRDQDLAPMAP